MKLKILLIGCLIANISLVYSDPKIMKQMKKMDSDKSGSITFEEFNSSSMAIELELNSSKVMLPLLSESIFFICFMILGSE